MQEVGSIHLFGVILFLRTQIVNFSSIGTDLNQVEIGYHKFDIQGIDKLHHRDEQVCNDCLENYGGDEVSVVTFKGVPKWRLERTGTVCQKKSAL